MKDYVDTGKVYLELYDYPLMSIHPGALMAAQAANCAAEQGAFGEMRQQLFDGARDQEWRDGSLDDLTMFGNYASDIGINRADFDSCLTTNRHLAQIKADVALAEKIGIRSTPTFIIQDRLYAGAQPYAVFKNVIDTLLNPP
jgi:protein-disulfide isomerase